MAANDQQLPSKEAGVFRTVLKLYDSKQHKKALKQCDAILKKFPDHGETLCMKGLTSWQHLDQLQKQRAGASNEVLSEEEQLQQKEEAFGLVKLGLRKNVKSYVCWHVFGILQRCRGFHKEAIKAYQNALKFQPENIQILKDTAVLQVQVRDIQGLIKTRQVLLSVQSTNKSSWIGFCVAHFLGKNYEMCHAIADSYLSTLASKPSTDPNVKYERSELLSFKARVFLESGEPESCLEFLNSSETSEAMTDSQFINEISAQIYFSQKKYGKSKDIFKTLIAKNTDNLEYHAGFIASVFGANDQDFSDIIRLDEKGQLQVELLCLLSCISDSIRDELKEFYFNLQSKLKKNWTVEVILINLLGGEDFVKISQVILKRNLVKGVPTLFNFFKTLYSLQSLIDERVQYRYNGKLCLLRGTHLPEISEKILNNVKEEATKKISLLNDVVSKIIENMQSNRTFPDETEKQTPDVLVWAKYFYAQHIYYTEGSEKSLSVLEEIIAECPTIMQVYLLKGNILKKRGQYLEAAKTLNDGRKLDLQDRYLNTKCTKSLIDCFLINAQVSKGLVYESPIYMELLEEGAFAEDVISLFAKHEGDKRTNLNEMQCLWYAKEIALVCSTLSNVNLYRIMNDFKKSDVKDSSALPKNLKKELIKAYSLEVKFNKEILDHFDTFQEDQHDFHSYSLRRGALNAYVDFLQYEDNVRNHPHFLKASTRMIDALCLIADNSAWFEEDEDEIKTVEAKLSDPNLANDEKKKLRQKLNRLKKALKQKENQEKKDASAEDIVKSAKKSKRRRAQAEDPDPSGLLNFRKIKNDAINQAVSYAKKLSDSGSEDFNANMTLCRLAVRRQRFLQAVKYLGKANTLSKSQGSKTSFLNAEVFSGAIWILSGIQSKITPLTAVLSGSPAQAADSEVSERTKQIVIDQLSGMLGHIPTDSDLKKTVTKYENLIGVEKIKEPLFATYNFIEISRAKIFVGAATPDEIYKQALNFATLLMNRSDDSFREKDSKCAMVHMTIFKFLLQIGVEVSNLNAFASAAKEKFPFFSLFHLY